MGFRQADQVLYFLMARYYGSFKKFRQKICLKEVNLAEWI